MFHLWEFKKEGRRNEKKKERKEEGIKRRKKILKEGRKKELKKLKNENPPVGFKPAKAVLLVFLAAAG